MELLPTKPLRQQQQQRVAVISQRQVFDIDARAAARDATTGSLVVSGSSKEAAQNAAICTTAHVQSAGIGDTYLQQSQNAQQLDWRHEK